MPKDNERFVYQAIEAGDMTIDSAGRIWRVARRHGKEGGGIASTPCPKVRAERQTPNGYLTVRAMIHYERRWASAHRVVFHHFFGPIPAGLTINHLNGVRDDNRPSNLELATQQEQVRHMIDVLRTGRVLRQSGEANHAAKLTLVQVAEARERRNHGETYRSIGESLGVSATAIYKICSGQRWSTQGETR